MYREEILDHYKRPRNEGTLDSGTDAQGENASCGDDTHIYVEVKDGKITDLKHETEGCAICTSAVSFLSEEIKGKELDELRNLDDEWMLEKLGIDISPMRMKCAMLGLETTKKAVKNSSNQQ